MLIKRLIMNSVWSALVLVVLSLMGIFFIVLLIGELGSIGKFHYTVTDAVIHCFLVMPSQLYMLMPMLGFLSAILGLGRLSSQNELVAVRAAGVSRWQITRAVIQAALVFIIIVTWIGEKYAFDWANTANQLKSIALNQKASSANQSHFWLKENNKFIYIDKVKNKHAFQGVTIFDFSDQSQLTHVTIAKLAVATANGWRLSQPESLVISDNKITKQAYRIRFMSFDFKPSYVAANTQDPSTLPIKILWGITHYRLQHSLAANQISFAFWLRIFQPINTLIMIWLGVPFVFGTLRDATMGYRLMMGVGIGFLFYMMNQVIGPLCMIYEWPASIAALLPSLLLFVFGVFILRANRT